MEQGSSGQLVGHPDSDAFGKAAALIGIVGFALRLACVLIPGVPGAIGQLVGLALGIPAVVLGIFCLSKPGHRKRMAVVGLVLGALITVGTIGVGIAA